MHFYKLHFSYIHNIHSIYVIYDVVLLFHYNYGMLLQCISVSKIAPALVENRIFITYLHT